MTYHKPSNANQLWRSCILAGPGSMRPRNKYENLLRFYVGLGTSLRLKDKIHILNQVLLVKWRRNRNALKPFGGSEILLILFFLRILNK